MIEIARSESGEISATNGDMMLTVLPDGETRAFKRRGIRLCIKTGETDHLEWLVAELDGVRLYINDSNLILTKQDLNP